MQAPTWLPAVCDGPNRARAVLDAIKAERDAALALRFAEREAAALLAKIAEDEKRAERELAAAQWNLFIGRNLDEGSSCYYGCGCDD